MTKVVRLILTVKAVMTGGEGGSVHGGGDAYCQVGGGNRKARHGVNGVDDGVMVMTMKL